MGINKGKWLFKDTTGNPFFNECDKIVNNDNLFKGFKQNKTFCSIIGNDVRSKEISDELYHKVRHNPLFKDIKKYQTNDNIGTPILYEYPDIGLISPGTLYFIDVLGDIIKKFGDLHKYNVIEIGSGYGGQAKIFLDYGINHYTCVDVKQPLSLCKKYLKTFNYPNVNYIEADEVISTRFKNKYDLVVSNWCLSEFDNDGIKHYIDNIIQFIDEGYFLMNIWDNIRKDYIIKELSKSFNVTIEPENTKTNINDNFLIYIKKKL